MSVLNLEVIIKINGIIKFDFTPKGKRSLYYTRCEAEIIDFPKGNAFEYLIPKGKVIFTVFENTNDEEKDPAHESYFKGGEILHLQAINYEQRSASNRRYIPADFIGQITANPKQLEENLITVETAPAKEEIKTEETKCEENAETIDLSAKIEMLKREIKNLEDQKAIAIDNAEKNKKSAEYWEGEIKKYRDKFDGLYDEKKRILQEIEDAKKISAETVDKTRIALVDELIKILPINGDEIVKLQIDVRELKKGNQKAFLWTKKSE